MLRLKDGRIALIRSYQEEDLHTIQTLNRLEGWTNLVENEEATKEAWRQSNIAYVMTLDEHIIGYIRGLTDTQVTLYICELIISQDYRGLGIGTHLLEYVHQLYPNTRMELLGSSHSHTYYEKLGFRAFYGFRRTFDEMK